jgi:hypothetical protein
LIREGEKEARKWRKKERKNELMKVMETRRNKKK